jgi:regulation of enolase protein 1 (concanavalin A-like superfamily)
VYIINKTIQVTNPNTVVLGLGLATLHADNGIVAMSVADVDGVKIAGLLFEAGTDSSPVLLQVGPKGSSNDHSANPTSLHDLYFRVGGDALAKADICIEINSNHIIGDHFWVWRADHGTGAAWDSNLTTNGMIVNGNDVTIYGLFVEHFHQYQTVWNGDRGRMYFYQTEIPYDVPAQESWMSNYGTVNGYASYKVADSVTSHEAYGLGIYSFFRDADVKLERGIEIPDQAGVKIHHATSVYLSGMGEITHIVNATGNMVKKGSMRATLADYIPRTTASIQDVSDTTITGKAPSLPAVVTQVFSDSTTKLASVIWDSIDPSQYASVGSYTVNGTVIGTSTQAVAHITVVPAPKVAVTSIAVTGAGNSIAITTKGGTLQMSAAVMPANSDNPTVTWSVVDAYGRSTDKATISAEGLLTAAKNGTVKVIATANDFSGVKGEATVTVSGQIVKASAITVTASGGVTGITTKGGSLQMTAAVTPANTDDPSLTWSVLNTDGTATDKAIISAGGLLTAKKDGTVKVIAAANDGSGVTGNQTITMIGQTVILGSGWAWVRESQGNWATDPNNANVMKLTTIEGSWGGTKPSNILLRDPGTTGDFTISTKLKFAASANFEWAGLIVYQSDGNLISLGRSSVNQIRFSQVKNGTQTDKNYADPAALADIYLKIEKSGTIYKGFYSNDGISWTQVTDTFNFALTNPKVGMFVRKLNTAIPPKTAEFSNFILNGSMIPFWNPAVSIIVTGASGATAITTKYGALQMSEEVLPSTADNKTVIWSIFNTDGTATDKAMISSSGLVTALKNGQVKVKATAIDGSGVTGSATIDITGQPVAVTSIAVTGAGSVTEISKKGVKLQMSAAVLPSNADNTTVTWSVYNLDGTATDKATISDSGLLSAYKDGQVKVVAAANDGSGVNGEMTVTLSGQEVPVTAGVTYSTTTPTNQEVIATLVTSEPVIVTNNNGVATRTFSANGSFIFEFMDAAGHKGTAAAEVHNIDKTAPTLAISVDKPVLSVPNHKMVSIKATVNAADNESGIASLVLSSITSSEADEGLGDGDFANDIQNAAFGTFDTDFSLRSERSARGKGRTYTITFIETDVAGNTTTATATVVVLAPGHRPDDDKEQGDNNNNNK